MGCCNEPASLLTGTAPDPTQHVNYARGMVLGVDDFTQEFTYLSGRDRWLARDALGYGTLSGLRVFVEDDGSNGPRVHVSAGSALVPGGYHVCVGVDQCCVLNRWLARAENAETVTRLLFPSSPPLSPPQQPAPGAAGTVSLYLVLCWRDCQTSPVPIPGEPCRDESELMAPSRVADDFCLELRAQPPSQTEEDALREFVRWLCDSVQLLDTSPPPGGAHDEAAWLAALRAATQPWLEAPPSSPPVDAAPPGIGLWGPASPPLDVAPQRLGDFQRVALRFWVTELRPLWMAMRCHRALQPDLACVLLARLQFEVVWVGGVPAGAWQVSGDAAGVEVDERARPLLAHLRLLQEAWLAGPGMAAAAAGAGGGLSPLMAGFGPSPPGGALQPSSLALPGPGPGVPAATEGTLYLPVVSASADLALDESHHCVLCRGAAALTLTLPPSTPQAAGRLVVVKNIDVTRLKVHSAPGEQVEGKAELPVKTHRAVTLIADGAGQWHLVSAG